MAVCDHSGHQLMLLLHGFVFIKGVTYVCEVEKPVHKARLGNEAEDDKIDGDALYGSLKHNLRAIYRTTAS